MAEGNKGKGGKTTRLMITKMVLENFKSYAGAQTVGPFHKRFSSIVGPNGSGKSNVIDALLFVFGKRATQLRLKKVSELIHKSAAFPELEYANVEVHFQLIIDDEADDDAFEVVPGSEFLVSRTAYKNNTSKYQVDSRTSNFNDVGILLRSHGIDLDNNRFLILQGEVEQIAMMEPKGKVTGTGDNKVKGDDGLLEYLEDIIGSNKYVEQIEEWSKSLDELNDRRIEKVNRMKVAEKERDNLSGSRAEAEEYLETERDIRRKQNTLFQHCIHEAAIIVEDVEEKKQNCMEKLAEEKKKSSEFNQKLAQSKKDYEETKGKYDAVCEELEKVNVDFNACERRDIKLSEDKKHVSGQIKKLEATVTKETKREADNTKESEKVQKELVGMQAKVTELEAAKALEEAKLEEIMSSLQASTAAIREQVEVKQVELGKAQAAVTGLQSEKDMVQTQLDLVLSRTEKNNKLMVKSQDKLAGIRTELAALTTKRDAITAQKKQTAAEVEECERMLVSNATEEAKLQKGMQGAIQAFEDGKAMLQAQAHSHSVVVDALLKAGKKTGPLANAGIRGRLGDLGTVAPEYDVAISTACGGMLDHIVVETVEGGQACLDYIRREKLGRVSLIVLGQMDGHRKNMEREFVTPQRATRLFDLITSSSPDLLPAFFCALQNCLVTDSLDSALKINAGGKLFRIVSMDGNMVEATGAMSGGGKSKKSGSMRLGGKGAALAKKAGTEEVTMTPTQLQKLEAAIAEIKARLANNRAEKVAVEKELKDLRAALKKMEVELEKSKMVAQRLAEQEEEVQATVTECQKNQQLGAAEASQVADLQGKLAQLDAQMEVTSPNLSSLKAEVAALQKSIIDVGGPKLKRTQLRISEQSTEIEALNTKLNAKEVEVSNCTQQMAQAAKASKKAAAEVTKLQEKLVVLEAEFKEMEQDGVKLLTALENAKALKDSQEAYLNQVKVAYDELCELVSKVKSTEFDLKHLLDVHTKTIKEKNDHKNHWEGQFKNVRAIHFEEKMEMKTLLKSFMTTGSSKKNIMLASSSSTSTSTAAATEDMDVEGCDTSAGDDMDVEGEAAEQEESADSMKDMPVLTRESFMKRFSHPDPKVFENKIKGAKEDINDDIAALKVDRDKLKENVNMSALMDYLRKDADYRVRLVELEEITNQRNEVRKSYEECRRRRLEDFMAGFGVITLKLKEMYQMITLGGDAELELVDSLDPFSEGIVFSVRPPKKSWKNISNLSGGEKTLSSLALVFALHHYKPTPLYVMDEIDAALDFKNVSIVANYIKERTKNAQFVIISLRNNMFELADRLVGIYKTYDCTKSVTINPKLFTDCGNIAINDGGSNNTGNVNEFKTAKDKTAAPHPPVLNNSTNMHS